MSREYWTLKGESGETAFLAGVVDVLSDTLSLVCDFTSAFDADIFYIPGNDLALLDDTVKRRLNIYHRYQENSYIRQSDIDRIHFDLEKTEEDITEYVCHSFQKYSSSPKLKKAVKDFFIWCLITSSFPMMNTWFFSYSEQQNESEYCPIKRQGIDCPCRFS